MRARFAAVLVAGVFVLVGAPMALAKGTEQHQFSGAVSRFDSAAKSLAVKEHGGQTGKEMSFTLASDVKIMQGHKEKSLGDLKVGERVRVTYADEGSTHQARRIDVLPPQTARAQHPKPSPKPKAGY